MEKMHRFRIPKNVLWEAFRQSEKTKVIGIDGQTIEQFTQNRIKLLHELLVELNSGNYVPSPVRRIVIPKKSGGWRPMGIPTVKDFIVQTLLKNELAPTFERLFHPDSFGYKQKRPARDAAIRIAGERCLQYDWAIVMDIKKFGENINHRLLMDMLKKHIRSKWSLLYNHRMMIAPAQMKDGSLVKSRKGLAQGSKLNILLGNVYLHHIFDEWMQNKHPDIPFERYTDDIICHCKNETSAKKLLAQLQQRFTLYKLTPHPEKTRIVYCKDDTRKGNYAHVSFEFLGTTFCSQKIKSKSGSYTARFGPKENDYAAPATRTT
ncbi:reverse transcriptase domain-containing protein [Paenibacillus sp. SC116]|uniref:reverse transcriptase domain-containing protein n=1 Tax=Paenibacillus sp. SC116 TaxID=2968986 RepID=UPI00215B2A6E|nr:reverse transcriptase domain-containing protein [Paenibacillus sp. SC116]MCR8843563.1 reverse transcriptase domain-containing protein [Paenibacillus sp. SC116]